MFLPSCPARDTFASSKETTNLMSREKSAVALSFLPLSSYCWKHLSEYHPLSDSYNFAILSSYFLLTGAINFTLPSKRSPRDGDLKKG
jgi:hypothetical protein